MCTWVPYGRVGGRFGTGIRLCGTADVWKVADACRHWVHTPRMAPAPEQCAEREKIAEAIRAVLSQILFLHAAKVDANDDALEHLDKRLEKATASETSLREMFQRHLKGHGCEGPRAVTAGE